MQEYPDRNPRGNRKFITILAGGAICIMAVVVGIVVWNSSNVDLATKASRTNLAIGYKAIDHLLLGVKALAEERGLGFTALQLNRPVSERVRTALVQKRREADAAFAEAIRLVRTEFVGQRGARLTAALEQRLRALATLRKVYHDWDITRPKPGQAYQWFARTSSVLRACEDMLVLVQVEIRRISSNVQVDVALRLQYLGLVMTDFAGRERAVISGAIAQQEDASKSYAIGYRGRVIQMWRTVNLIASTHDLPPEIRAEIASIEKLYFEDLEEIRKSLQLARKAGAKYPIPPAQWFDHSSAAVDKMLLLARRAGELARQSS